MVSAHVLVITAYCILGLSLWRFQKVGVLSAGIAYNILMIAFFFMIDGTAGMIASVVEIVRNGAFYIYETQTSQLVQTP